MRIHKKAKQCRKLATLLGESILMKHFTIPDGKIYIKQMRNYNGWQHLCWHLFNYLNINFYRTWVYNMLKCPNSLKWKSFRSKEQSSVGIFFQSLNRKFPSVKRSCILFNLLRWRICLLMRNLHFIITMYPLSLTSLLSTKAATSLDHMLSI